MAAIPSSLTEAARRNGSSHGHSSISFGRGGAGTDMDVIFISYN